MKISAFDIREMIVYVLLENESEESSTIHSLIRSDTVGLSLLEL